MLAKPPRTFVIASAVGGCAALLCCSPGVNYAEAIAEPAGILLDTGKGYRRTVIEGEARVQRDRFTLPVPSATIELWSKSQLISTTHADLDGHFIFTKTLTDGKYTVKMATCPRVEASVTALIERRFTVTLLLLGPCVT